MDLPGRAARTALAWRFALGAVLGLSSLAGAGPAAGAMQEAPTPGAAAGLTVEVRGLSSPVRVVRDRFGVTHVFAASPHDAAIATGYLHAADRLFQMDLARRRAEGTLAELLGPDALSEDVSMRTLGLARAAERVWPNLSEGARADLEGYAAGVNAFIARASALGLLPAEYGRLELTRVRPWRPQDSLSVLKLFAFQLSFHLEAPYAAILQAYMEALGPEKGAAAVFRDLWRLAPVERTAVIPDAVGFSPQRPVGPAAEQAGSAPPAGWPGSATDEKAVALGAAWMADVASLAAFSAALAAPAGGVGSNWFLISPKLSESGYAILASDPHLPLTAPPAWYAQHVSGGPELDVAGVALPGLPWVILGFNRRIAWGATASLADTTDTFIERLVEKDGRLFTEFRGQLEPVRALPQRFVVNRLGDGVPDNFRTAGARDGVPETVLEAPRHGPIVRVDREAGKALSVRWSGFYSSRDGEGFYRWNRARNLADFLEGLAQLDLAPQNWAYADTDGNVAYFSGGKIPLREDLDAGYVDGGLTWAPFFLRDGTGLRRHEWKPPGPSSSGPGLPFEVLPPTEMPHVMNPPAGFIVSANNDPLGTTLDGDPFNDRRFNGGIYYLAPAYNPGYRAARITELIRERVLRAGRLSVSDAMAIQSDVVQRPARRLLPFLLAAWETAEQAAAATGTGGGRTGPQGPDRPGPSGSGSGPPAASAAAVLARFRTAPMAEAIGYLRQWDFSTPTGVAEGFDAADRAVPGEPPSLGTPGEGEIRHSVAATVFHLWVSQLIRNAIDAPLAAISPSLPRPDGATAVNALIYHLERFDTARGRGESGIRLFDIPELDLPPAVERDVVLLKSLEDALALLGSGPFEAAFGRRALAAARWGRLHRLVLRHPLGRDFSIPPLGGFEGDAYLEGIPVDGGFEVVDASGFDPRAASPGEFRFETGSSVRLVVEMVPGQVRAFMAVAGGPTGNPADPEYGRLLPVWLANDYSPVLLEEGDARQAAAALWTLVPEPVSPEAPAPPGEGTAEPGGGRAHLPPADGPAEVPAAQPAGG